jgi:hypothetical protein
MSCAVSRAADAGSEAMRAPVANRSRFRRAFTKVHEVGADPMKLKKRSKKETEREPMGIVISGGPVSDAPPVFAAYVWGPAPEKARPTPEPKVA